MEIKKGMKFKCIEDVFMIYDNDHAYIRGNIYDSEKDGCITDEGGDNGHKWTNFDRPSIYFELLESDKPESPQRHYDNTNGSLYQLASRLDLNHWEFDILKRLVRCRKKGQFEQDLQKIKDTVDIYLQEYK